MADEDLNDTSTTDQDAGQQGDQDTQDTTADDKDAGGQQDDKKGGSLLDDPGDDKAAVAPADWPEDWRAKLAGDDDKLLKRLERMKSPKDVLAAYRALEQKMSSGEVKATLPKDATEEQIAEYRKANGIPDKPEGYLESLPNGLVVGDDDKEMVNSFLESAHGKNASPEFVASALDWYYSQQEEAVAAQDEADKEVRNTTADELRAEWGSEYRANFNSIKNFVSSAPDGLGDLLMGARLADGTLLGDNAKALRWLAKLADDANPAGFVSPSEGGSQSQSIEDEIESIKKVMRENRKAYDKDEKMQARLRQLYDAQDKLKSRAA